MADVLDTARRELGTTESPANSNKVRYNTWYYGREVSGDAYPWCMAFVQWVFAQAGKVLPYKTASCSALLSWYRQNRPECIVRDPMPGDIILYTFSHTGIVESVQGSTVTAIEEFITPGGDKCKSVVITTDKLQTPCPDLAPPVVNSREDLIKAVRACGLVGLGGAGFPTHIKLNPKNLSEVDTLRGWSLGGFAAGVSILLFACILSLFQGFLPGLS